MPHDHTDPGGMRVVRSDNGQIDAIEEVKAGILAALPPWLKYTLVVLGVLTGAGFSVAQFVPVTITPVWETKDEAKKAHDELRTEIRSLPALLIEALDKRDELRAATKGKRR